MKILHLQPPENVHIRLGQYHDQFLHFTINILRDDIYGGYFDQERFFGHITVSMKMLRSVNKMQSGRTWRRSLHILCSSRFISRCSIYFFVLNDFSIGIFYLLLSSTHVSITNLIDIHLICEIFHLIHARNTISSSSKFLDTVSNDISITIPLPFDLL